MVDDSGEAKPADGALPSAPAAPAPPAAVDAPPAEPTAPEPPVTPPAETPITTAAGETLADPSPIESPGRTEPVEAAPVETAEVAPAAAIVAVEATPATVVEVFEAALAAEADVAAVASAEPSVGEPLPSAGEGGATAAVVEGNPEAAPDAAATPPAEDAPVPDLAAALAVASPVAAAMPAAAATAIPASAPLPRAPRSFPPMLEFAAWRVLELVVTIGVAVLFIGLLIRGETPADPAILADRLGVTVPLVVLALLVAMIVGLPIGYASARFGGWLDVALRALTTLGVSFNPVWLAMLLVLLLALTLQWMQPGGFIPWSNPVGALTSLVLPALALGLPLAAEIASRMRDALTAILAGPAMRTADMRGYSCAEAIRDFALRLALARTFARLAVPLALLVPMSLVIEAVFYLPGLGRMIFTALAERDFATLQLGLVTLVALVALCRFLGHVLEASFDARIAGRA